MFFHNHAEELLKNKTVIVLGDSIHRSIYKDLVCLFKDQKQQNSRYLFDFELRAKGEKSFLGDCCLVKSENVSNGTDYREVREFKSEGTVFRFYFITRVFSDYMESVLNELKAISPHVLIMNSTFWDIHKYSNGMEEFKSNLEKLLQRVESDLPKQLVFIWNAAPPLKENCKGGFLNPGTKTLPREQIIEANKFAEKKLSGRGLSFQFNDLFSALTRHRLFQQAGDGIHWDYRSHRKMSNMILAKICLAWKKPVPEPPQHCKPVTDNSGGLWEGSPYGSNNYYPEAYYPDDEGWGYEHENGYFLEQPPHPRHPPFPLSRYEEPYPQGDVEDYDNLYYPTPSPSLPRPQSFPEYNSPHYQGFDGNRSLPDLRNYDYYEGRFEGFDGNRSLPIHNGSPVWSWNNGMPTPPAPHRPREPFFFNQPIGSPALSFNWQNQLNTSMLPSLMGSLTWPSSNEFCGFSAPQQGTEDGYKAMFRRFSGGSQSRQRKKTHPYKYRSSQGWSKKASVAAVKKTPNVTKTPETSCASGRGSNTASASSSDKAKNESAMSGGNDITSDGLKTATPKLHENKLESGSVTTTGGKELIDHNSNKIPSILVESCTEGKADGELKSVGASGLKRKRESVDCESNADIEQPTKLLRAT